MTINNQRAYDRALWDWGFLDQCFGNTRIRLMDIDGFVERNSRYLAIEGKGFGKDIPTGEMITFHSMVKQGHWVLVIWGYQTETTTHDILLMTPQGDIRKNNVTKAAIQDLVRDWFLWADGQGVHFPESLRPYLDVSLSPDELDEALVHIRQFNIEVCQVPAGDGKFRVLVK